MSTSINDPSNTTEINSENIQKNEKLKKTIVGSYMLTRQLGEGAFGKVREGINQHNNERAAVKILEKAMILENDDEDDLIRVQQEISILKHLKHKNVVQLYEIIDTQKNLYLVTELCENGELYDQVLLKKRLDEPEACKYFQDIIDGLDYLHSQQIVHRDIKLENLLLDSKMNIKITDFGLSKIYPKNGLLYTYRGTYAYCPPEFFSENETGYKGELSDVWSSGVVLYTMLQGYLPFTEAEQNDNIEKICAGDYEMPDDISDLAKDLINSMLTIDPDERISIKKIKKHPWFNLITPKLMKGIIINFHKIPVDEVILKKTALHGYDESVIREKLINNVHDKSTGLYYLYVKKFLREGKCSVSDFQSNEFIRFIENPENILPQADLNYKYENDQENREEKENENFTQEHIQTIYLKDEEEEEEDDDNNNNNIEGERENTQNDDVYDKGDIDDSLENNKDQINKSSNVCSEDKFGSQRKLIKDEKLSHNSVDVKKPRTSLIMNDKNNVIINNYYNNNIGNKNLEANKISMSNVNNNNHYNTYNNKRESVRENKRYSLEDDSLLELENYIKSVNLNLNLNLNLSLTSNNIDSLLKNEPNPIIIYNNNNTHNNSNVNINYDRNPDELISKIIDNSKEKEKEIKEKNNSSNTNKTASKDSKNNNNKLRISIADKPVLKKRASDVPLSVKNRNVKFSTDVSEKKIRRSSVHEKKINDKVANKKCKNYNTFDTKNRDTYKNANNHINLKDNNINIFSKLDSEIKNVSNKNHSIKSNFINNNLIEAINSKRKNNSNNKVGENKKSYRHSSVPFKNKNILNQRDKIENKEEFNSVASSNYNNLSKIKKNYDTNDIHNNIKCIPRRFSQPLNDEKIKNKYNHLFYTYKEKNKKINFEANENNAIYINSNKNYASHCNSNVIKRISNLISNGTNGNSKANSIKKLNKKKSLVKESRQSLVPKNFKREKKSVFAEIIEKEKEFLLRKNIKTKINCPKRISQIVDPYKIKKIIKKRMSCIENSLSLYEKNKVLTEENAKQKMNLFDEDNIIDEDERSQEGSVKRSARSISSYQSESEGEKDAENPKRNNNLSNCDVNSNNDQMNFGDLCLSNNKLNKKLKSDSLGHDITNIIDEVITNKYKNKKNNNFDLQNGSSNKNVNLNIPENLEQNLNNNEDLGNKIIIDNSETLEILKKKITFEEKEKLLENIISNIQNIGYYNENFDEDKAKEENEQNIKEDKKTLNKNYSVNKIANAECEDTSIVDQSGRNVDVIKEPETQSENNKETSLGGYINNDNQSKTKIYNINLKEEQTINNDYIVRLSMNAQQKEIEPNTNLLNKSTQNKKPSGKEDSSQQNFKNEITQSKTPRQKINLNKKQNTKRGNKSNIANKQNLVSNNPLENGGKGNLTDRKKPKKLSSIDNSFYTAKQVVVANKVKIDEAIKYANKPQRQKKDFNNSNHNTKTGLNEVTANNSVINNLTTNNPENKKNKALQIATQYYNEVQAKVHVQDNYKSRNNNMLHQNKLKKNLAVEKLKPENLENRDHSNSNNFISLETKRKNVKSSLLNNRNFNHHKKAKLKLISNSCNIDCDSEINLNRNNSMSISSSPKLARNLSLSQNKQNFELSEKLSILPSKIKKNILQLEINKNINDNHKINTYKDKKPIINFNNKDIQNISFSQDNKTKSQDKTNTLNKRELKKTNFLTEQNNKSSNLLELNQKISKKNHYKNPDINKKYNNKSFINISNLNKVNIKDNPSNCKYETRKKKKKNIVNSINNTNIPLTDRYRTHNNLIMANEHNNTPSKCNYNAKTNLNISNHSSMIKIQNSDSHKKQKLLDTNNIRRKNNLSLDLDKISENKVILSKLNFNNNKNKNINKTKSNISMANNINTINENFKSKDNIRVNSTVRCQTEISLNKNATGTMNLQLQNLTSRDRCNISKGLQVYENKDYENFKNKILKQLERLKVKVNKNQFKKNLQMKYQLNYLKQANNAKFNRLADQYYTNKNSSDKYKRQSSLPNNIDWKSKNYDKYYDNILHTENIGKYTERSCNLEVNMNSHFKHENLEVHDLNYVTNDNHEMNNAYYTLQLQSQQAFCPNNLDKEIFQYMNQNNTAEPKIKNSNISPIESEDHSATKNTNIKKEKCKSYIENHPEPHSMKKNNNNFNKKFLNYSPQLNIKKSFMNIFRNFNNIKNNNIYINNNNSILDNYAESYRKNYLNTSSNITKNNSELGYEFIGNDEENNIRSSGNPILNHLKNNKHNNNENAETLRSGNNEFTHNTEIKSTNKIIKNQFMNKKPNLYEKYAEKILKEELRFYNGPIDKDYVLANDILQSSMVNIDLFLKIKKISFVKLSKYDYLCSWNGISFELKIFMLNLNNESNIINNYTDRNTSSPNLIEEYKTEGNMINVNCNRSNNNNFNDPKQCFYCDIQLKNKPSKNKHQNILSEFQSLKKKIITYLSEGFFEEN